MNVQIPLFTNIVWIILISTIVALVLMAFYFVKKFFPNPDWEWRESDLPQVLVITFVIAIASCATSFAVKHFIVNPIIENVYELWASAKHIPEESKISALHGSSSDTAIFLPPSQSGSTSTIMTDTSTVNNEGTGSDARSNRTAELFSSYAKGTSSDNGIRLSFIGVLTLFLSQNYKLIAGPIVTLLAFFYAIYQGLFIIGVFFASLNIALWIVAFVLKKTSKKKKSNVNSKQNSEK